MTHSPSLRTESKFYTTVQKNHEFTPAQKKPKSAAQSTGYQSTGYQSVPCSNTTSRSTEPLPSHRRNPKLLSSSSPPPVQKSSRRSPTSSTSSSAALASATAATMPSCRLLPHGTYSLIPAVLSAMAWLASLFQDGCDFARLSGEAVQQLAVTNNNVPWLEVGISAYREPSLNTQTGTWQTVFTGACLPYPETESNNPQNDPSWQASKAFDFVALVLGGAGTFFLWFATCCVFSKATWRWAGYEVLLAAIAQCLSFLWFNNAMCQNSSNHCDLFWGSKADIVSSVFWTVAALSILCHYPTPKELQDGDGVWVEHGSGSSSRSVSSTRSSASSSPRHRTSTEGSGRSPTASQPSVELGPNTLRVDAPTMTTAAATMSIPAASDDSDDHRMATGEASQQSGNSSREMKDVELT